jgi:hypothetical protein
MPRSSACCILAFATLFAGTAVAAETGRTRQTPAEKLCDSYGPGFVPAGAPGNCVKVQERLRVEPQARRGLGPFDAPAAFAPLPTQTAPLPAHLRLNGGFGEGGPR